MILHSFHHSSVTCFCFYYGRSSSQDSSSVTCFCFYYGRSSGRVSSFFPSFLCHVFLFLIRTQLIRDSPFFPSFLCHMFLFLIRTQLIRDSSFFPSFLCHVFLFLLWMELMPRFFILSIIPLSRVFLSIMDGARAVILHSFHHSSVTCFSFYYGRSSSLDSWWWCRPHPVREHAQDLRPPLGARPASPPTCQAAQLPPRGPSTNPRPLV